MWLWSLFFTKKVTFSRMGIILHCISHWELCVRVRIPDRESEMSFRSRMRKMENFLVVVLSSWKMEKNDTSTLSGKFLWMSSWKISGKIHTLIRNTKFFIFRVCVCVGGGSHNSQWLMHYYNWTTCCENILLSQRQQSDIHHFHAKEYCEQAQECQNTLQMPKSEDCVYFHI